MDITVIIITILVALILVWFFATYNSLISLKNKKDNEWSHIDVELKRRADLIPNLVETVKGYTKHEKKTLDDVVKARNSFMSAQTPEEKIKESGELSKVLNKLFALAESYPDLKASDNFLLLQQDLKDTEDKISIARGNYNNIVLIYNNKIQIIPNNIVAGICGFKKGVFFEATEEERKNVKVSFE